MRNTNSRQKEYKDGGGYTLVQYWKRVEDKEWTIKEDVYFLCNYADGDVHGYYKARLDNDKIIFSQYSDYDDIVYDTKENRDTIKQDQLQNNS